MFRFCWISTLIILSTIGAYVARMSNVTQKTLWTYMVIFISILGTFLWAFVSKRSDNLILDNSIFDITLTFTYVLVLIYLGCGDKFSTLNWIGVGVVLTGFLLMKI